MHQIRLETFHFNVISMTLAFFCVFWMRGAESEQAQNSCSSASIESLFGAKGFSSLHKSLFTGGRSASRQKPQRQRRICRNPRRNAVTFRPAIYNQSRTEQPKIFRDMFGQLYHVHAFFFPFLVPALTGRCVFHTSFQLDSADAASNS